MGKQVGGFMIQLSLHFTEEENACLLDCTGGDFEILTFVEGDSYILCDNGEYYYNDCFEESHIEFFSRQRYVKVTPNRIIKFYNFYLMSTLEEPNIWYRGRKDAGGNWEYDNYSDSLEEAFDSL